MTDKIDLNKKFPDDGSLWVMNVEWNFNPDTGRARQGYTSLLTSRAAAEQRATDAVCIITSCQAGEVAVTRRVDGPDFMSSVVSVRGEKLTYSVARHAGDLENPGPRIFGRWEHEKEEKNAQR